MSDSYFQLIERTPDVSRYASQPTTAGPWSPTLQHGGPPNALAVAEAERAVAEATGRTDLVALRLAADFVGAVPVAEIELRTRLLRTARSAALAEVVVSAEGRDCLLVRVWFVRDSDTAELARPLPGPITVPELTPGSGMTFGYGSSIEWRMVTGDFGIPGPGAAWARPFLPLLDGHELSGLSRVVLVADSASGVSAELDWAQWSFVNVDLDVHLARPFEGEWVLMDATTQLGGHGSALARSTLSDVRGVAGAGLQTLVVAPIPTG